MKFNIEMKCLRDRKIILSKNIFEEKILFCTLMNTCFSIRFSRWILHR